VVFRMEGEARARSLSPFAALVLESAVRPGTANEIVQRVAEAIESADMMPLTQAVLEQLKNAYSAGLIQLRDGSPPAATPAGADESSAAVHRV
jgi:hypothetical protein